MTANKTGEGGMLLECLWVRNCNKQDRKKYLRIKRGDEAMLPGYLRVQNKN